MNISTNPTNFSGKQEILYGLRKAAQHAKSLDLCTKAYSTSRIAMTKYEERTAYNASIKAYLDMIFNDRDFVNSVNTFNKKELRQIRNILKEEKTEHGIIQPLEVLKEHFGSLIKSQKYSPAQNTKAASELLEKLA